MAAHRKLWHKGLQRCALLTRKLGLDLMESNQPSTRGHEIRDSSLISTSVRMVHLQRTSDEKRPGRGRQRINPREFATTGPRTPETAAKYLLHPGLRQDGGGDQRGVSKMALISCSVSHGFYDIKRNLGHLNLGLSHDTSRFACDSLGFWWEMHGQSAYPHARHMLLLCDGGGSNASNRYVFKYHLESLANRIGLEIRVAHYPPYCSKHNPIEHRFFPHVTRACQGLLLTSTEVTSQAMARASTKQGLKTTVHVLTGDYPLKEGYPDEYRETMKIRFDEELPVWNYRAIPGKCDN